MFRKLLRYDLHATMAIFKLQAIITLVLSVPYALVWRFLDMEKMSGLYEGLAISFMSLMSVWLFVSYFLVQCSFFSYYKKNFFSDEGYLTFTLPVSRRQLLLSKTAGSLIFGFLQVLVYLAVGAIVLLLAPTPEKGSIISLDGYRTLWDGIVELWSAIGAWLLLYILEGICLIFCLQFLFVALVYYGITLDSALKKNTKNVPAFLVLIMLYFAVSNLLGTGIFLLSGGYYNPINLTMLIVEIAGRMTAGNMHGGWALLLSVICAALATIGCTLLCMTLDRLERKLNLN